MEERLFSFYKEDKLGLGRHDKIIHYNPTYNVKRQIFTPNFVGFFFFTAPHGSTKHITEL